MRRMPAVILLLSAAAPAVAAPAPRLALSFDQLDADSSGYVSPEEAAATTVGRRFQVMDRDRDGRVSRHEYLGALGLEAEGPSTFALLDANGDGRLSPDEASVTAPLATRFHENDADGDNFLDQSEFSAFQAMEGAAKGVDLPWPGE